MPEVPSTLDAALSPEWLTTVLGQRFPGVRVERVEPGPVVSRLSTNARCHLEGDLPDGLAADLCVKGYFAGDGAPVIGLPEALFYRDLATAAGIRTLRPVYAAVDPVTYRNVVITEDVVAQGGSFLDGTSRYSPDQVAEGLEQLALLHATTWESPRWAAAPWLAPRMSQILAARGEAEIRGNFLGPIGVGVPDEVRDPQRLVEAYGVLTAAMATAQPWTVLHGDTHVGNVFIDAEQRPAFVDWQLVQRGPWYVDVGYHIASALTVDDRRASERDLLQHYLGCLGAAGIDVPAFDGAWTGMLAGIVHGLFLWGITLQVDPPVTTELLRRLATAAADHDALGSVLGPAR